MADILHGQQKVKEAPKQKSSRSVQETLNSAVWKKKNSEEVRKKAWKASERQTGQGF